MLKRLLAPLAGFLVAGNVFSQDIFSFYFPTNKNISTSILSSFEDNLRYKGVGGVDFSRFKESFVDTYVRVLDDRISTSKASIYRTVANGGDYNLPGAMSRAFADTIMDRYEIAIEIKKFAEGLRDKATIQRNINFSSSTSASGDRPYKFILRPSVKGINQNGVGLEFVLKDADKDSLALARFYWDRAELRVPLGNVFKSDEKQDWFNRFLKKVSMSARAKYGDETNSSFTLSYESPWD